jgi:hypothetical protein
VLHRLGTLLRYWIFRFFDCFQARDAAYGPYFYWVVCLIFVFENGVERGHMKSPRRLLCALLAFVPPAEARGGGTKNQDVIYLVQANVFTPLGAAACAVRGGAFNPEEVIISIGGRHLTMHRPSPETPMAAQVFSRVQEPRTAFLILA